MFINNYIISILHPVERSLSNVSGLYFASAGQSPVQPLVLLMRRHQFFVSAALYPTWGSAPPRSGIQDSPTGSRAVFLSFFGSVLFLLYSYSSCSISLVLPSSDEKIDWPKYLQANFLSATMGDNSDERSPLLGPRIASLRQAEVLCLSDPSITAFWSMGRGTDACL